MHFNPHEPPCAAIARHATEEKKTYIINLTIYREESDLIRSALHYRGVYKAFYIQSTDVRASYHAYGQRGKRATAAQGRMPSVLFTFYRWRALYHGKYHDLWNLEQPLPGLYRKAIITPWIYVVPL